VRQAQTRGLPRLPLRVERPKDVFNPSGLNVRLVQGASRAGGFAEEDRISDLGGGCASPTATSLKLTPMGGCRIEKTVR
jgi:hypothetical protein